MPSAPLAIPAQHILDHRIHRVILKINQEPRTRIPGLARHVHLSPSRLEHLFKEQTGQSLSAYVLAVRLAKAAELLQESGLHIKEVAMRAGYAHAPSFNRAFKRRFGLRPRAYRLKNSSRRWL